MIPKASVFLVFYRLGQRCPLDQARLGAATGYVVVESEGGGGGCGGVVVVVVVVVIEEVLDGSAYPASASASSRTGVLFNMSAAKNDTTVSV